jgi:peptidoglycan L-alanyl-D-glutamate endopeptidase CwlK
MDQRSEKNLIGVNPDLVKVVKAAADKKVMDFIVTEGVRTVERQKQLVAAGASRTMKSRHLTGDAVDLAVKVNGEVRWDWPLYEKLGKLLKDTAQELGIKITWGGDWTSFKDGPHFQIP